MGTELLSLRERQLKDADEEAYLALLRNVLKASPMYFSYTHDITNSFQRQAEADLSTPLWKRADDRFFWNRFIQSDLIDFRNGGNAKYGLRGEQAGADPFILPVMSGMLEIKNTSVKGKPLTFTLITRKSRFRVGTRYFTRGIDKDGHVANFNETEMIVVLDDSRGASGINGSAGGRDAQVLSYVQTRGSVPVYWAEINTLHYTPSLQIRGVESAQSAAKIHFDEQIRLYGDNYLVNLVNQKGREKRVKDAYEQMVHLLQSGESTEREEGDHKSSEKFTRIEAEQHQSKFDKLHYVYFDFHNETKGLQWHRAQLLMDEIQGGVMKGGYFRSVNMPGSTDRVEVRTRQSAVVRTNCMDCLDRTNVVQSMLGRFILSRMLIDLGYMREGENASDDQAFEHLFRNIWADNADIVSKSYSGTGALKTDFTRTGNRTKQGALNDGLNSATRYVRNNFLDGPRQDAFDLFLGNYLPSSSDVGRDSKFADNRPLAIQSVPYVLGACLFFVLVGSMTRRDETAMIWPLRSFMLACCLVSGASAYFMWSHGTLYVSLRIRDTVAVERSETNSLSGQLA